jgi:hypothetical protein
VKRLVKDLLLAFVHCHFIKHLFHQMVISSSTCSIKQSFHQAAVSSNSHFIKYLFHQVVVSSSTCFIMHPIIKWLFHQLGYNQVAISPRGHSIQQKFHQMAISGKSQNCKLLIFICLVVQI